MSEQFTNTSFTLLLHEGSSM